MSDSWATPAALYADLNNEFHFTDDPCYGGADKAIANYEGGIG